MFKVTVHPKVFRFAFEAGTSRGIIKEKTSWFIRLEKQGTVGWGECSPIEGLSPEPLEIIEEKISTVIEEWKKEPSLIENEISRWKEELDKWPSLRFALETAWLDYKNGGKHVIYQNDFCMGKLAIPINGLVWMNTIDHMQSQIEEKLKQGFRCIKLKIGHHDTDSELRLLKALRDRFSAKELMIRVDANGAYHKENVFSVLDSLAQLEVHSIEQPVAPGQWEVMKEICQNSPLAIALDEELINVTDKERKENLLDQLKPHYLVLKPSLHGGMLGCKEWIDLAERASVGWWMTSYLESAIGLNAIAQFTAQYANPIFHGLGTGKIYTENISSPLFVEEGALHYHFSKDWGSPV